MSSSSSLSQIVVHYAEVGTKGANRSVFEDCLGRNIVSPLLSLGDVRVEKRDQRFLVQVPRERLGDAKERIAAVFGVSWFAEVETAPLSYGAIRDTALAAMRPRTGAPGAAPRTFRVSARRSNKSFEMTSQELARSLGADIVGALGIGVSLTAPDVTLFVDVVSDKAIVYTERSKGPGGLPVGVSGRVLHLLSGGIDSPVAAWLMMKRGCSLVYLHFYVAPDPGPVMQTKIPELLRVLTRFGREARLILIPFAPYQVATTELPEDYEPTVFRHFMRIVAERVAERMGFAAISTGDNLAQVASQTLQNISCIDAGASISTLRPLLTYDKDEIIQLARRIGTYEESLRDYKDCCSIVSRHPRTRMRRDLVLEAARSFGFDALAEECIRVGSLVEVSPGGATPSTIVPLQQHCHPGRGGGGDGDDGEGGAPRLHQAGSGGDETWNSVTDTTQ